MGPLQEAYYGGILVGMILVIVFLISIKIIGEIMDEYNTEDYREIRQQKSPSSLQATKGFSKTL